VSLILDHNPEDNHELRKISSVKLGIAEIFAHRIESYNWVMINKNKHLIFVERTHGIVGNGPVLEFGLEGEVKTHMMPIMPCAMKNPSIVFVRDNEEHGKVYLLSQEGLYGRVIMYDTFSNDFKTLHMPDTEWPNRSGA
jgi:hypothetical protein